MKAALILAAALIASVGLWLYFSPYHTCVRASDHPDAEINCAAFTSGYRR